MLNLICLSRKSFIIFLFLIILLFALNCGNSLKNNTGSSSKSIPAIPKGIIAIREEGQILISWISTANTTSYNIYWALKSGVTKRNGIKISNVMQPPYIHTGLSNTTTYYYVVTAVNSYGESAESQEVLPFKN